MNVFPPPISSLLLTILSVLCLSSGLSAADLKIEMDERDALGLESLLEIHSYRGTLTSDVPLSSLHLDVKVFKDGEDVSIGNIGVGLRRLEPVNEFRFAVWLVDTDQVPLGDKPGD